MTLARYYPPGLGIQLRSNWPPRRCQICKETIPSPTSKNQKAHDGACRVELDRLRNQGYERKRKAAALAKRDRKRVGLIKGTKPARDRKYLDWLRLCRCIVCKATPCDPAHVGPIRGLRQKCDDKQALPMCRDHHNEQHRLQKLFWPKYSLDREALIAAFNLAFAEEMEVSA